MYRLRSKVIPKSSRADDKLSSVADDIEMNRADHSSHMKRVQEPVGNLIGREGNVEYFPRTTENKPMADIPFKFWSYAD